jgi:hypothetical protein
MGHDHVILSMSCRSEEPLIAWTIDLVTGLASVAELVNYAKIVASTQLAAFAKLIVDRFFTLLVGRNTCIESGFHK